MKISIRIASKRDLKDYTDLLQRTYQVAYTDEKIGLTKERFSKEVFATPHTQSYLKSNLVVNDKQKTWLAFLDSNLVGSITITDKSEECELRGFYVTPQYQGKGIGKKLWNLVLDFAGDKDIVLDLYSHNRKTIEMYKKWGFKIDKQKGVFYRHWPEWPEDLKAKSLHMRFSSKRSQHF
ncbi:MAG: hypothetical protein A2Z24_00950 [Candidatus Woykebacteria bacterium RBG_16_44_10]|uniref:N-acetyltransferase domain-containing protein n=1 Tax=Candidatus Woykebacteria bacterium RBG_16_44_10 TaxID=1802597 RepID=A0A1G1WD90_9BACT|nr:MAG: hypothetical protein A2Z24_00950 [Candidatus Woykebacteria bacterium RBG_16_44_10]